MEIIFKSIQKKFITEKGQELKVLKGVDEKIFNEEFVVLIGPSGCGKSTLLNIIAGLEKCSSGKIIVGGETVTSPSRDRGMVFQQDALLMWRKVIENVEYGLELSGVNKSERKKTALEHLEKVGLKEFADFYPKELSGGMRKRVQIASVFSNNPKVMLMDEPFGSLDYMTKLALQDQLLDIWTKQKKTTVFVTHDIEEAIFLADRIFLLKNGIIDEVFKVPFSRPRNNEIRTDEKFRNLMATLFNKLSISKEYQS
tara:strand:- start:317 stop:1081 length:765 start_codon:yes stop_codon:yes gene_type:complete